HRVCSVPGPERVFEEPRERLLRLPADALELERVESDLVAEPRRGDLQPLAVARPDLAHAYERELVRDLERLAAADGLVVRRLRLRPAVRPHSGSVPGRVAPAGRGGSLGGRDARRVAVARHELVPAAVERALH